MTEYERLRAQRRRRLERERRRKKRMRRRVTFVIVCALLLLALLVTGIRMAVHAVRDYIENQPEVYEPASVSLVAVGDNLIHNTLYMDAEKSNGAYDFTPFYQDIKPYIQAADIAVVNQESPLGTGEPSGYPDFNTPQECGDALVSTGFDVIGQANNHAMDSGAEALVDTMNFWDEYANRGVIRVGLARSAEDRAKVRYVEKNGLKIGFLAYTYGLNDHSLPDGNPDLVSLIDEDTIARELAAVRAKCDAVVVLMHWGEEYDERENKEQRRLAKLLTQNGATLIIGSHPHVGQPAKWVESENGNRAYCVYSLGNFISAQERADTVTEGMLQVTLTRDETGAVRVQNPGIMPMVCYYTSGSGGEGFRVLPLDDYTDSMAKLHALADETDVSPERLREIAENAFGDALIGKTVPVSYSETGGVYSPEEQAQ